MDRDDVAIFAAGSEIHVTRSPESARFVLSADGEAVGKIALLHGLSAIDFRVGDRGWSVSSDDRDWAMVAVDEHNRRVGTYAERWLRPGRLTLGTPDVLAVWLPVAWRGWRVKHATGSVLTLDAQGEDLRGRVAESVTPSVDLDLLVGFVATIVVTRRLYRPGSLPGL